MGKGGRKRVSKTLSLSQDRFPRRVLARDGTKCAVTKAGLFGALLIYLQSSEIIGADDYTSSTHTTEIHSMNAEDYHNP